MRLRGFASMEKACISIRDVDGKIQKLILKFQHVYIECIVAITGNTRTQLCQKNFFYFPVRIFPQWS